MKLLCLILPGVSHQKRWTDVVTLELVIVCTLSLLMCLYCWYSCGDTNWWCISQVSLTSRNCVCSSVFSTLMFVEPIPWYRVVTTYDFKERKQRNINLVPGIGMFTNVLHKAVPL